MNCWVSDCISQSRVKGLCKKHYDAMRRNGDPTISLRNQVHSDTCTIDDCNEKYYAKGYCTSHYYRWLRQGDPLIVKRSFVDKEFVTEQGYIMTYSNGVKKLKHRKVIEDSIGRELLSHENVHHKNGIKTDNRLSNLELWSTSQPAGQRIEDKVEWALEILERYPNYWKGGNT